MEAARSLLGSLEVPSPITEATIARLRRIVDEARPDIDLD
jgi:hypothetical protein